MKPVIANPERTRGEFSSASTEMLLQLGLTQDAVPRANYSAIAFDWCQTELGRPEVIEMRLSVVRLSLQPCDISEKRFVHVLDLGATSERIQNRGASESIGLVSKTPFFYDSSKRELLERTLADLILYRITSELAEGYPNVLIEGPLFPKLAGRLGYRHFDRNGLIAGVTFKTDWLPNVAPSTLIQNKLLGNKGIFFKEPFTHDQFLFSDIESMNGLSEALKSWAIYLPQKSGTEMTNRLIYAVDMFCQFPWNDSDGEYLWKSKLQTLSSFFQFPGLVFENGQKLWLPFGLACAYDRCIHSGSEYGGDSNRSFTAGMARKDLAIYENFVPQMYETGKFSVDEVVARRVLLYRAVNDDKLFRKVAQRAMTAYSEFLEDHNVRSTDREREMVSAIQHANTYEARGSVLSALFDELFVKGQVDVVTWKRII